MSILTKSRQANVVTLREKRVPVSINVGVQSILTSNAGTITDLTTAGAKIMGDPFPVGAQIKIEFGNTVMWARVRWQEEDRYGVQFETQMPHQLSVLLKTPAPANIRNESVRKFGKRVAI